MRLRSSNQLTSLRSANHPAGNFPIAELLGSALRESTLAGPGYSVLEGRSYAVSICDAAPYYLDIRTCPFFLILVCHYAKHEHFRKYFPLWTCGYNQAPWDLFFYLAKILLSSVSIVAKRSSFLAQLTYLLAVLIVIACVNVTAKNVYESQQHFALTEVSIVVVALSVGFLRYFLAFAPGSRAVEWLVVAAIFLLNGGFLIAVFKYRRPKPFRETEDFLVFLTIVRMNLASNNLILY